MKKTHPKTFRNHQSLGLLVSTLMLCLIAVSVHGKTIRLTLQHMEQPPTRVEAMQVVIDKFNEKYPQYHMKQNVVGWGEAYSRVTAQVEAGVAVDLQQAIPAFFSSFITFSVPGLICERSPSNPATV